MRRKVDYFSCLKVGAFATFKLMPNKYPQITEKGFSPLFVLIVATILLAIIGGGAYFLQLGKSQTPAPIIPVTSIPPTTPIATSTITPTTSNNPAPTPTPTASQKITITQVSQPDCTSSSCGQTTVVVISGTGFSTLTKLSATGQTNGNPYTGTLSQASEDGKEIDFDLLDIPCQNYTATITNPMPTGSSATFSFYPKKC